MNSPYQPISCDLHDTLEALAINRRTVSVRFQDATGAVIERRGRIVDVFTHAHAEFMVLETGESVRLDHLVSVNDGGKLRDGPAGWSSKS